MDWKKLVIAAVVIGGAIYLYRHRASAPASGSGPVPGASTSSSSTTSGWDGHGCVRLAEEANGKVQAAGMLLTRPPVDAEAFRNAESAASSAISSAESACSGAAKDKEREASEAVRAALGEMRGYLSALSGAAGGSGGVTDAVQRQETIDGHLARARSLLGG